MLLLKTKPSVEVHLLGWGEKRRENPTREVCDECGGELPPFRHAGVQRLVSIPYSSVLTAMQDVDRLGAGSAIFEPYADGHYAYLPNLWGVLQIAANGQWAKSQVHVRQYARRGLHGESITVREHNQEHRSGMGQLSFSFEPQQEKEERHPDDPDLRNYDLILLNTSGGKDSIAMMDKVINLAKEAGVLDRVKAVHADLGEVEWKGTRELAEQQAKRYAIPFEAVSRPQGNLLQQIEHRGMWPSSQARYCTSDHKRSQIQKIMTAATAAMKEQGKVSKEHPFRVLNVMGLRAEESTEREKMARLATNKAATTQTRHVDNWLPIHDWSESKVWKRIRDKKLPYHYAYDLGMPRLSCVFCVFAPKSALVLAAKHNPELFEKYLTLEKKMGHTFRHKFSLEEVKKELESGKSPEKAENWRA